MTRNGQLCHIVGVHRQENGHIQYVTVEMLVAASGRAERDVVTGVNPHDLATENSKAEVFQQIASVEGVTLE